MLTTIAVIIAVVAILIFANGLYVGAEFATVGARRTRIRQMAGDGDRMAQRLLPVLEDHHQLDDYVAACQLGITISSLVLAAFGERYVASAIAESGFAGEATSSIIILALFTLFQVVFGELFPKSIAVLYPERLALIVIIPIQWSRKLFRPLIWLFNGSGQVILRLLGYDKKDGHGTLYSAEEIEMLVSESHEGGLLQDEERKMLRNAFRLEDLTARQIMVHRTKIVAVSIETPVKEVINVALEAGHTRIPVYQESVDNIVGFVHIKDVFRLSVNGDSDLQKARRDVVYVPEALPAIGVWEKLNAQRKYMAVVFDEYGGTEGIITQEDLIEEIFGELQDEFDNEEALIRVDKQGRVHLRADLLVSDVNEYLQLSLPTDGADTIGGLVFSELGRRPEVGAIVNLNEIAVKVEVMDDLRIAEVSIPASASFVIPQISEWEVKRD